LCLTLFAVFILIFPVTERSEGALSFVLWQIQIVFFVSLQICPQHCADRFRGFGLLCSDASEVSPSSSDFLLESNPPQADVVLSKLG
jgi:hypothetical protein